MKKSLLVVLLLSLVLLTSCGLKHNQSQSSIEQQKRTQLIKKNRSIWNKKVKAAKNVNQPNYDKYLVQIPEGYDDESMSLKRLKNGNQNLIVGQVLNLQPEFGRLFVIETKATVYVKKVISGDTSLKGKTIKTEFSGGLSKAKDYFNTFEGEYVGAEFGVPDKKTIIYSDSPTKPMPGIGDQIIVGIKHYKPESEARKKMYLNYGLTTENFYVLENPETTFWVKKKKSYRLNNPAFYLKENSSKIKNMLKLTEQLNKNN